MLLFYPNSVVTIYFDTKNSLSQMFHDYPLFLKILNQNIEQTRNYLEKMIFNNFQMSTFVPHILEHVQLTPVVNKRKRMANRQMSAYVVDNVVENYEIIHSKCYVPPRATSDIYKNSFFV